MKYSFIFLSLIFIISCTSPASKTIPKQKENSTLTTYYLIRHAEKDRTNPEDKNPPLDDAGNIRAQKWAEIFSEIPLVAVYSSNFKRTLQTATPTAENIGLEINIYDPHSVYETNFKKETEGKNILVVGHSNTIPKLANYLLGEERYGDIEDNIDGNLYIVTILGDKAWSTLLSLE